MGPCTHGRVHFMNGLSPANSLTPKSLNSRLNLSGSGSIGADENGLKITRYPGNHPPYYGAWAITPAPIPPLP